MSRHQAGRSGGGFFLRRLAQRLACLYNSCSMPHLVTFLLGFLAATAVAWILRRHGMRTIRGLEQQREELLTEESRMFSFLHEIDENLAQDRGMRRLHE